MWCYNPRINWLFCFFKPKLYNKYYDCGLKAKYLLLWVSTWLLWWYNNSYYIDTKWQGICIFCCFAAILFAYLRNFTVSCSNKKERTTVSFPLRVWILVLQVNFYHKYAWWHDWMLMFHKLLQAWIIYFHLKIWFFIKAKF